MCRECLHALSHRVIFDPKNETREFRICMADISEVVLLPRLLNYPSAVAPGIFLDISKISPETPRHLKHGEIDLAVGFMPHLEAGFYQQKLFDQNFVCLAALDHSRIHSVLTCLSGIPLFLCVEFDRARWDNG